MACTNGKITFLSSRVFEMFLVLGFLLKGLIFRRNILRPCFRRYGAATISVLLTISCSLFIYRTFIIKAKIHVYIYPWLAVGGWESMVGWWGDRLEKPSEGNKPHSEGIIVNLSCLSPANPHNGWAWSQGLNASLNPPRAAGGSCYTFAHPQNLSDAIGALCLAETDTTKPLWLPSKSVLLSENWVTQHGGMVYTLKSKARKRERERERGKQFEYCGMDRQTFSQRVHRVNAVLMPNDRLGSFSHTPCNKRHSQYILVY